MNSSSNENARMAVIEAAKKYHSEYSPKPEFVAGKTYIPVTAKVVDEHDLGYLIDASLDMWLTAGRYARRILTCLAVPVNQRLFGW